MISSYVSPLLPNSLSLSLVLGLSCIVVIPFLYGIVQYIRAIGIYISIVFPILFKNQLWCRLSICWFHLNMSFVIL